jgi:hypothetical protein
MISKPGESKEQQVAEEFMIKEISRQVGANIISKRIFLDRLVHLDVDGLSEDPPIMCEAWAHIGPPKPAQKAKVMADAFKLVFLERRLRKTHRKMLLFADEVAREAFVGATWRAEALRQFEIQTILVELPGALREAVAAAQKRQYR